MASEKNHEVDLWQRLGHLARQSLQETITKRLVNGMSMSMSKATEWSFCEGCVEGKIYRKPFNQWENFIQLQDYSWFTVMCVVSKEFKIYLRFREYYMI